MTALDKTFYQNNWKKTYQDAVVAIIAKKDPDNILGLFVNLLYKTFFSSQT
jgi:hypothetical protein